MNKELLEKSVSENLEQEYFRELQAENARLFPKFSEREWLEIFPEALELYIFPKIEELKVMKKQLEKSVREAFGRIKNKADSWFLEQIIMFFSGQDLIDVKNQLVNLQHLAIFTESSEDNSETKHKKGVSSEEVNRARDKPIERVVEQYVKLKKFGSGSSGLCPFHKEKTPSFRTFNKTNSFYCFGCHKGGNPINFIMDFLNLSFVEAVRHLNNNY